MTCLELSLGLDVQMGFTSWLSGSLRQGIEMGKETWSHRSLPAGVTCSHRRRRHIVQSGRMWQNDGVLWASGLLSFTTSVLRLRVRHAVLQDHHL
jgi:hypothetical protein